VSLEDTIVGLVGGFLISLITFYIGMRIQRQIERKQALREHIRKFFPTLRELTDDLSYAISIKLRSEQDLESFGDVTKKICAKFELFEEIYSTLRNSGLEPELESADKKTANELKGLFILWRMEGTSNFKDKIDQYYSKVIVCKNLVEAYLKT
jgi:hypothetical protein